MSNRSLDWLIIVFVLLASSCHKEAVQEESGCNCKGKAVEVVRDAPAQITASVGRYLILEEAVSNSGGSIKTLFLCDTLMLSGLPTSKPKEYDYLVSGNLRPPCTDRGFVYIWNMELTSIRKK